MKNRVSILAFALALPAPSGLPQTISTAKGTVRLIDAAGKRVNHPAGGWQEFGFRGSLRNDTDFGIKGIILELTTLGPNGAPVNACNFGIEECSFGTFRDIAAEAQFHSIPCAHGFSWIPQRTSQP
jgi:hypothetical protein